MSYQKALKYITVWNIQTQCLMDTQHTISNNTSSKVYRAEQRLSYGRHYTLVVEKGYCM